MISKIFGYFLRTHLGGNFAFSFFSKFCHSNKSFYKNNKFAKGLLFPQQLRWVFYLIKVLYWFVNFYSLTAQKKKFSINDFSSKCERIRSFLRIWWHLLKESLIENLIFCAVPKLTFGLLKVGSQDSVKLLLCRELVTLFCTWSIHITYIHRLFGCMWCYIVIF